MSYTKETWTSSRLWRIICLLQSLKTSRSAPTMKQLGGYYKHFCGTLKWNLCRPYPCHKVPTTLQNAAWIQALKPLSKDCNFQSVAASKYREESIRDAFNTGLRSPLIFQRLLGNNTLDLKTMLIKLVLWSWLCFIPSPTLVLLHQSMQQFHPLLQSTRSRQIPVC